MFELLALGGIVTGLVLVAAVLGFVFLTLKFVFWLVFLPIRLAFKLLWLPVLLLKTLVAGVLALLAGPLLIIVVVLGALALVAAVLVPLLPLVFLGLAVWALFKLFARPAVA